MDDAMLDLFGEEAVNDEIQNSLITSTAITSQAALFKTEETYTTGCCQRLAWSKTGSIANLSADGTKITFRAIVRDTNTGVWSLSDGVPQPIIAPDGTVFRHIEWSTLGLDLLAFDQNGLAHLYTIVFALNRLQSQSIRLSPTSGDSGNPVGLHWLPIYPSHFKSPLISTATRQGQEWTSRLKMRDSSGVHHAIDSKGAFLLVTRSNVLKLVYQQDGQAWQEVSTPLSEVVDSSYLLSHAAFGDAPEHLLLATYDYAYRLHIYRIEIAWNLTTSVPSQQAQAIPSVSPQLHAAHLTSLDHCLPEPPSQNRTAANAFVPPPRPSPCHLSHLYIIAPSPATVGAETSPSQVMALFLHRSSLFDLSEQSQSYHTSICRWEISRVDSGMHSSFQLLKGENTNGTSTQISTTLNRLQDISMPEVIISANFIHLNSIISLSSSHGAVEFRDRETFNTIVADGDDSKASSLPQNGFAFFPADPCTEMALSPNGSMAVVLLPDGSLKLNAMEYLHGWAGTSVEDHLTQAALVSIAREFAILCSMQYSNDEVLALIPPTIPQGHRDFIISQIFRSLSRSPDFSLDDMQKQSSRVFRDALLSRILCTQLILGYDIQGDALHRNIPAKVAWVVLNLNRICSSIMATMNPREPASADTLLSLRKLIMWYLDLMLMILNDLFSMSRALHFDNEQKDVLSLMREHSTETNSPSVHLLFCSSSRAMLRFVIEMVKAYQVKLSTAQPRTVLQRTQLSDLKQTMSSLPYKLGYCESVLSEIDAGVRSVYTQGNVDPAKRAALELSMLTEAQIPDIMSPIATHLLKNVMGKLREKMDEGALHFWDTLWIGLEDDRIDSKRGRETEYDVLRKTQLMPGMMLRMCRKCGGKMEDVVADRDQRPPQQWIAHGQKYCVCLGYWILI